MKLKRLSRILLPALLATGPGLSALADTAPEHREHLVVITEVGPVPTLVEVAPGDRIVWINRSASSMTAIRFTAIHGGEGIACPEERAFRRIDGVPLFTNLLAPGSIAVTCAPQRGSLRYELSGDHASQGWVMVVGEPTP